MNNTMKINEEITVGPQPNEADICQLSQDGYKSVVNFRTDDEEKQPLLPQAEAEKVKAANMEYLHLPVSMKSMSDELVDQFREKYDDLPKPVFAHCKSGKRAGAMVMMKIAVEQGMTGEQTLQNAEEMGFKCEKPDLVEFVKKYVDSHTESW
jgi:uncharacterized protein (TIGR01244 family)